MDAEMGSIAARALGRGLSERAATGEDGGGDDASGSSAPRRSLLRRRLQGASNPDNAKVVPPPEEDGAEFGFEGDPLASQLPDTLAQDEAEASGYAGEATPFDDDYDSGYSDDVDEDDVSQFEYRAPFTARRNPLKMWTAVAAAFALLATGTVFAVNYYGLPEWLPFERPTFGIGKADLELNFPETDQRKEVLDTGETIFRVRGAINNVGRETVSVPRLIVVFVDERDREIFSKVIVPAKSELAPGESLKVTEAISDYPEAARKAGLGWSPN